MYQDIDSSCSVGFFGMGVSNLALMRSFAEKGCHITLRSDAIIDKSPIFKELNISRIFCGRESCRQIDEDIIFFSPSVRRDRPELFDANIRGVKFSSDAELFFAKNSNPVFAISGSDGKSTTATLINLLLQKSNINSRLIGNIGEPMFKNLGAADCFVCELSSFMLQYCSPRVDRACITNITPNHLDWHKSFSEYREAKLSLLRGAREFVITDLLMEIPGAFGIVSDSRDYRTLSKIYRARVYYTIEDGYVMRNGARLIRLDQIRRKESYNLQNLMLALAMTDGYYSTNAVFSIAREFSGLPHRCEHFLSVKGVDYYNSSIDTSPSRSCQTINALGRRAVVILGGKSKGLDYSEMLPTIKKWASAVVVCGENRGEIISSLSSDIGCYAVEDFEDAVRLADGLASEVGALILSPASTSYDRFSDYRHRGNEFKRIITDLHKGEIK